NGQPKGSPGSRSKLGHALSVPRRDGQKSPFSPVATFGRHYREGTVFTKGLPYFCAKYPAPSPYHCAMSLSYCLTSPSSSPSRRIGSTWPVFNTLSTCS